MNGFRPARRRINSALAVLPASMLALPARAQSHVVRLVVGYAAGGPVDAAARFFAPEFGEAIGANVVVDNRTGANATIAGENVRSAAPDGTTIWFAASPTMTIAPHVMKAIPFDPLTAFTPIAPLIDYANVLVINRNLPFKDVRGLVAYAKAHPGELAYGSAGVGSSNHLSGELLAQQTGTKLNHIPYKGNAPAMSDVIGGQIAMMFDIVATARQYVTTGKVLPLAVTSRARNPALPDVPTMIESGLPDYDVGGWYALYGPPKLPEAQITRIRDAAAKAVAKPALNAKLLENGYTIWGGDGQTVQQRAVKELGLWKGVTKDLTFE